MTEIATTLLKAPRARSKARRVLAVGCLGLIFTTCLALGVFAFALRAGALMMPLPGGTTARFGGDAFVLSNYSFQNGQTYYADFKGNGVRNIVELHLLGDGKRLELVFHHSTAAEQQESHLLDMPLP